MGKPIIRFIFADLDNTLYPSSEVISQIEMAVAWALKDAAPIGSRLRDAKIEYIAEVYKEAREKLSSDAKHFPYIFEHFCVEETERLNAAARVAYHKAKFGLLRLYPQVLETIIATRENNGFIWGEY